MTTTNHPFKMVIQWQHNDRYASFVDRRAGSFGLKMNGDWKSGRMYCPERGILSDGQSG